LKLSDLFDPLLLGLALLLAGLILWHRSTPKGSLRLARAAAWAGLAWLTVASCPQVSNGLLRVWQPHPVDLSAALQGVAPDKRAMIVLSAGRRSELGFVPPMEQLDGESHGRLLGAARIYAAHEFGVIVLTGTGHPFMQAMSDFLTQQGVPRDRIVLEIEATDTRQNAAYSAALLRAMQPERIVLVTSALHMRRSLMHFRRAGLQVIPAPVDYQGGPTSKFLPSSKHLMRTSAVLHELFGFLEP